MKPSECEGCTVYSDDYGLCRGIHNAHGPVEVSYIKCPCKDCLIKPMCNKICKEFERVRREFKVIKSETN